MNETKLKEILRLHLLWLNNSEGGRRADLTGANLTDADLTGADLTRCTWCNANLHRMIVSYRGKRARILFEPAD